MQNKTVTAKEICRLGLKINCLLLCDTEQGTSAFRASGLCGMRLMAGPAPRVTEITREVLRRWPGCRDQHLVGGTVTGEEQFSSALLDAEGGL